MLIEKMHVTGSVVTLDGNEFHDCVFERCTFKYSGGEYRFIQCVFIPPQEFQFHGAANRTVELLRFIYDFPEGAEDLKKLLLSKSISPPGAAN